MSRVLVPVGHLVRSLALLIGLAGGVRAQAPMLPLELDAGATCLRRATLEKSLSQALAQRVEDPALHVQIEGSADDPRTAAIRLLRDQELLATRTFSPGPHACGELHEAVALAIAMMVRNAEPAVGGVAGPVPAPLEEEPRSERRAPTTTSKPLAPSLPPTRALALQAAGVWASHVGASSGGGLRSELAYGRNALSARAGVLALFSGAQRLDDTQVRYGTRPLAASLHGCVALVRSPRWLLNACVGLLAGRIRLRAREAADVHALPDRSRPWFALDAELSLARRLTRRSWLFFGLEPVLTLRRLGVSAHSPDGSDVSATLPRFGGLFALGISYDFLAKDRSSSGMDRP